MIQIKSSKHFISRAGNDIVKDVDGNVYHTVTIGTQIWFSENLRTTGYNDGKEILMVCDNTTWESQTGPARCWYDNDATNYSRSYSAIYNYYAIDIGRTEAEMYAQLVGGYPTPLTGIDYLHTLEVNILQVVN